MAVKLFEDLEVWKEVRRLTQRIYQVSKNESFAKDFALRDQIRRAAVSIMSNNAEGFERGGNQELFQFLYVAKASCGEVRSQVSELPGGCRSRRIDELFQAVIEHDQQSHRLSQEKWNEGREVHEI